MIRYLSLIILCTLALNARSQQPADKPFVLPKANKTGLKLVAFMPSLSHHCEYASMLTHAFQHYFVEGLAWEPEMPCCESEVVLIIAQDSTNDNHQKNADICKVRIIHRI